MKALMVLRYSLSLMLSLGCMLPALGQTPGTEDSAFNIENLAESGPSPGFGLQPDGKLLVVNGSGGGFIVRRYLDNGQVDASFGNGGIASVPVFERGGVSVRRVLVDPLGRIYVYGGFFFQYSSADSVRNETGSAIARLLESGAVDTSFGAGGVVRHQYSDEFNPSNPSSPPTTHVEGIPGMSAVTKFGLLPDGKLLVVGSSLDSDHSLVVARLDVNGQLDASLGGTGYRTVDLHEALSIYVMKTGHDGSVVMLSRKSSTNDAVVLKLTAQGTLDTSFGNEGKVRVSDSPFYQYSLSDLEVQPDGMILLGGAIAAVPGSENLPFGNPAESVIARLTANGALDTGFGSGGLSLLGLPDRDAVLALALEQNGKILAAGATTSIDTGGAANSRPYLVRTLANGQLDASFQQQILDAQTQTQDLAVSHAAYLPTSSSGGMDIRKFVVDSARTGSLSTGQPSTSGFRVDVLNAAAMPVASATTSHMLGLHGYIYPQAADLGADADVIVLVWTAYGTFMRTTAGAFVVWDGQLPSLVPAYEDVELTARTHVPVFAGALPFVGPYAVYLGYMRAGGPLIYIDEPKAFQITQ